MKYNKIKCDNQDFDMGHRQRHIVSTVCADWSDLRCPCGANLSRIYADGEDFDKFLDKFLEKHIPHSNGFLREEYASDWYKFYTEKPEIFVYKLMEKK